MGRPKLYNDDQRVVLCAEEARSKLQANSDRRAVINYIIDSGGAATFTEINAHFGFDIRQVVISLINSGWLRAE